MSFKCIHCGSTKAPRKFIDAKDSRNKSLGLLLTLLTIVTCGLFLPLAAIMWPIFAERTHTCRGCGIKLG